MSKTKPKKESKERVGTKKSSLRPEDLVQGTGLTPEGSSDIDPRIYQEVLESLSQEEFKTLNEAVEAIVDRLIEKLPDGFKAQGLKEFLLTLLDSDPEMMEVVESLLKD